MMMTLFSGPAFAVCALVAVKLGLVMRSATVHKYSIKAAAVRSGRSTAVLVLGLLNCVVVPPMATLFCGSCLNLLQPSLQITSGALVGLFAVAVAPAAAAVARLSFCCTPLYPAGVSIGINRGSHHNDSRRRRRLRQRPIATATISSRARRKIYCWTSPSSR